jgi:hypothetical protein
VRALPLAVAALTATVVLPARAEHPLATEDAATLGTGTFEFELSSWAAGIGPGTAGLVLQQAFAVHVGPVDWLDLGVSLAAASARRDGDWVNGLTDPAVDAKFRLLDPDSSPVGLALRLDYAAPVHSPFGRSHHHLGGIAVLTAIRGRLALHANLGAYAHVADDSSAPPTIWLSLATGWELPASLVVLAEVWAQLDVSTSGVAALASAQAGLLWTATDTLVLSLGIGPTTQGGTSWGWAATVGATLTR